jgi:hypothetical protein
MKNNPMQSIFFAWRNEFNCAKMTKVMYRQRNKAPALSRRGKPTAKAGKATPGLSPGEKASLTNQIARINSERPAPRVKVVKDGAVPQISLNHPNEEVAVGLLAEALGTSDQDFVLGILSQIAAVSSLGGAIDESAINFVLAVIKGTKPNDQLEAMLALQMAIVHLAQIRFATQLARVKSLPQQDSAERALNKLARTFTTQLEALKRYRTGGEQKVTVQHVSVNEGGQAIVGNVTQATGENASEPAANPVRALSDARQPAMTIDNSNGDPVSLQRKRKNERRSST